MKLPSNGVVRSIIQFAFNTCRIVMILKDFFNRFFRFQHRVSSNEFFSRSFRFRRDEHFFLQIRSIFLVTRAVTIGSQVDRYFSILIE